MNILELKDLLFTYPSQDDKNIQSIISSRQEFVEVGSLSNESQARALKQGDFYNHQKVYCKTIYKIC